MDARQAVDAIRTGKDLYQVARFIENQSAVIGQQSQQITDLEMNKSDQQAKRITELEGLAELGQLTVEAEVCYWGYQHGDGDCQEGKCCRNELCLKRAELVETYGLR